VESTNKLGPSRLGLSFFSVVGPFLPDQIKSKFLLAESLFIIINWSLVFSVDNIHQTTSAVNGGVKLISNDSGVGSLVISDQFDLSSSSTRDISSRGDSHSNGTVGRSSDGETKRSINNNMTLESSFVFLTGVRNLESDLLGHFTSKAKKRVRYFVKKTFSPIITGNNTRVRGGNLHNINLSLKLSVIRTSVDLSLSENRKHNWKSLFVLDRETEHSWHL